MRAELLSHVVIVGAGEYNLSSEAGGLIDRRQLVNDAATARPHNVGHAESKALNANIRGLDHEGLFPILVSTVSGCV